MKQQVTVYSCILFVLFYSFRSPSATSIDISGYDSGGNFLGLAVDPADHHIFLTGLGYGGGPKLWQFAPDGTLVSSTIPIGLKPSDEILSIVVGKNGRLFMTVVFVSFATNSNEVTYDWKVVETDRAGTTVYSFFTTGPQATLVGCHPLSGNLFFYLHPGAFVETTLEGSVVNSFAVNLGLNLQKASLYDIVYNPLAKTVFAIYATPFGPVLVEYKQHGQGKWKRFRLSNLSPTGVSRAFGLDLDPSTGLFYAQDMWQIVCFALDDLTKVRGKFKKSITR